MARFVFASFLALVAIAYGWTELMQRERKHARTFCTMEYSPVCGTVWDKRQTFGNLCLAGREGAAAIVSGTCDAQKSLVRFRSFDQCIAA